MEWIAEPLRQIVSILLAAAPCILLSRLAKHTAGRRA